MNTRYYFYVLTFFSAGLITLWSIFPTPPLLPVILSLFVPGNTIRIVRYLKRLNDKLNNTDRTFFHQIILFQKTDV